jgi:ribonucleoside-triphosphate reductase
MAKCGAETEVYSRVCGYHRPVKYWNRGKREEFKDRKNYDVDKSIARHLPPEAVLFQADMESDRWRGGASPSQTLDVVDRRRRVASPRRSC